MNEKLITAPYLYEQKVGGKLYIMNLMNPKHMIKKTDKVDGILKYFSELNQIPKEYEEDYPLIQQLIEQRALIKKSNLIFPALNIELELTNYCNAHCKICPRIKLTRKKGFLSEENFNRFLQQLKQVHVQEVELCGVGEPLLHKNAANYVQRLKMAGIRNVRLVTNASLLTHDVAKKIVDAGIDQIMISFHSINKEKYEGIMGNLKYQEVLEHIKYLAENYKEQVNIIITCVVNEENKKEVEEFKKFWKEQGIENLFFQLMQSRAGILYKREKEGISERCLVYEQGLFISWDGKYLSCSNDFTGETSWAYMEHMTILKCLEYKQKQIKQNKLFPQCAYCDYSFRKEKYYDTNFYKYAKYQDVK